MNLIRNLTSSFQGKTFYILFIVSVLLFVMGLKINLQAQTLTQTIRGTVMDQESNFPLPGVYVIVIDSDPQLGTVTDQDGHFRLDNLPIGRYNLKIASMGYEERILPDILIGSGKEVILNIDLRESLLQMEEVVVTAKTSKSEPNNEMATVSARSFTVEETKRYAASVNDPSRMALSFAGVSNNEDSNNEIIVRGNSPKGMLWKVEGVEVPNPNHFGEEGASGGGISILSVNMLSNSDFLTGAFPAEYGNAFSGVFDIRLRNGNNEKREYAFQAGLLGIDFAAEGPFSKNSRASYLVNYRYSTLSLLDKIGVSGFEGYIPEFQDLAFKLHFPTKSMGSFSVWSLSGDSRQSSEAKRDSLSWEDEYDRFDDTFGSQMTANGLTHTYFFNQNTSIESIFSYSGSKNYYSEDSLDRFYQPVTIWDEDFRHSALRYSGTINSKISSRNTIRSGIIASRLSFNLTSREADNAERILRTRVNQQGNTYLWQGFFQWMHRFSETLSFNAGIHSMWLGLNNNKTIEPRAGLKWAFAPGQSINAGFGVHSRMESLTTYFGQQQTVEGTVVLPNQNLDLMKSYHYVLGYDRMFGRDWHLRLEAYYQDLDKVAIAPAGVDDQQWQTFALINNDSGYIYDTLVSEGSGRNYGIELTLEKYFTDNWYMLATSSLFESKYTGRDGIERDTYYNGNFVNNLLIGKEYKLGPGGKNILSINSKLIWAGGRRTTPIDFEKSAANDQTEFYFDRRYSIRQPDYSRMDLRVAYSINRKSTTSTISLDIQNVTNRQNIFGQYYDRDEDEVVYSYQLGLLPVLNYRLEF